MDSSTIVAILGIVLTILNIADRLYVNKRRLLDEGKTEQMTASDVQTLRQGNANILLQLDKMDTKMDNHNERLIRVEESIKSAHKRIDTLEGCKNGK